MPSCPVACGSVSCQSQRPALRSCLQALQCFSRDEIITLLRGKTHGWSLSQYRGVIQHPDAGWEARIYHGRPTKLGFFASEVRCSCAAGGTSRHALMDRGHAKQASPRLLTRSAAGMVEGSWLCFSIHTTPHRFCHLLRPTLDGHPRLRRRPLLTPTTARPWSTEALSQSPTSL